MDRRARRALGMTQKQLGAKLGVDAMTVSRWERGPVRPGTDSVRAIEQLRRRSSLDGVVLGD
jgi:transcriptional regulator with XRE-family HTH domain